MHRDTEYTGTLSTLGHTLGHRVHWDTHSDTEYTATGTLIVIDNEYTGYLVYIVTLDTEYVGYPIHEMMGL